MDKNKLIALGAVLVIGVVIVLGWMLGISPKLAEASAADANRGDVETQNSAYESQLVDLKKQFENMDDLKDELASLRDAIPNGAQIPAFVAQLGYIADEHQVTLTEIKLSDAEAYAPEIVVAPAAADATATEGDAAAPAADAAAAAPAVPAAPAAPIVPDTPKGNPLVTAQNFVAVPFSLTLEGDYENMLAFIDGLQKGTRLAMVTEFATDTVSPGSSTAVHADVSGFVYVLLDVDAADAASPATEASAAG